MAGLPKAGNVPATPENPPSEQTTPALHFEHAEAMPDANEINSVVNPFQVAVNKLVQSGGATSVLLDQSDVKWARDNIRRAANNVGKGGKTREVPEKDSAGHLTGKVRVWFTVGEKVKRTRKNK